MNFTESLSFLNTLGSFENKQRKSQRNKGFSLDRYKLFLDKIKNPQNGLKYVHVAGSKGKGSTCNFIAKGLSSQGFKTGLFTSPYILDIREQITINGEWISKKDFSRIATKIRNLLEQHKTSISYFEFINTIAFFHFKEQKVDYAVLEVGLGGLKDSTNVITPSICVLTTMEYEHTDVLGTELNEILANKLGILKAKTPLVVGWQKYPLKREILRTANSLECPTRFAAEEISYSIGKLDRRGSQFTVNGKTKRISLIGEHFIQNSLTALLTLKTVIPNFKESLFWKAAQSLTLKARLEIETLKNGSNIVFDMAHTAQGAHFLHKNIAQIFPNTKKTFLLSFLKDKNIEEIVKELEISDSDTIIATQNSSARSLSAETLHKKLQSLGFNPQKAPNAPATYRKLRKSIQKNELLVCTGSHFLLQDLYQA